MIRFLKTTTLFLWEPWEPGEQPFGTDQTFGAELPVEAEVMESNGKTCDLKFADHSWATDVDCSLFEVVNTKPQSYSPFDDPPEEHESFA